MDIMTAIFSRRSIRKYKSQPVPEETIQKILRAGMSAPSAGNQQPWHFIVVNDRKILDEVPKAHPYSAMVKEVTVAILVCGDESLEKHKGFWVQDCSAATQNILLAAHGEGLGAVWLGVYPREDRVKGVRELFRLPNHVIPLALIPIGYPGENKLEENRYNKDRVKYNHW